MIHLFPSFCTPALFTSSSQHEDDLEPSLAWMWSALISANTQGSQVLLFSDPETTV
jgi:hypothetical protein